MASTEPPRRASSTSTSSPSSQGSGVSRKIGPFPLWVWLVGVGGVGIWYYRKQQAAAAAATGATDTSGSGATVAGVPATATGGVDTSGGTNATSTTPTLQDWATAALNALKNAGVAPANAEKAIADFLSGNQLSADEARIINQALTLAGYPPETLPFYGTYTPPAPTPPPSTHTGQPTPAPAVPGTHPTVVNKPAASLLNTSNYVTQLAGRYHVTVPAGGALAALIAKLPGYKPTTDVNQQEINTLAAEVGYISSNAHLKTPSWAQINTQAAAIARSHGQNFATLAAPDRAAYQQQANVQLLEFFNPVRTNG